MKAIRTLVPVLLLLPAIPAAGQEPLSVWLIRQDQAEPRTYVSITAGPRVPSANRYILFGWSWVEFADSLYPHRRVTTYRGPLLSGDSPRTHSLTAGPAFPQVALGPAGDLWLVGSEAWSLVLDRIEATHRQRMPGTTVRMGAVSIGRLGTCTIHSVPVDSAGGRREWEPREWNGLVRTDGPASHYVPITENSVPSRVFARQFLRWVEGEEGSRCEPAATDTLLLFPVTAGSNEFFLRIRGVSVVQLKYHEVPPPDSARPGTRRMARLDSLPHRVVSLSGDTPAEFRDGMEATTQVDLCRFRSIQSLCERDARLRRRLYTAGDSASLSVSHRLALIAACRRALGSAVPDSGAVCADTSAAGWKVPFGSVYRIGYVNTLTLSSRPLIRSVLNQAGEARWLLDTAGVAGDSLRNVAVVLPGGDTVTLDLSSVVAGSRRRPDVMPWIMLALLGGLTVVTLAEWLRWAQNAFVVGLPSPPWPWRRRPSRPRQTAQAPPAGDPHQKYVPPAESIDEDGPQPLPEGGDDAERSPPAPGTENPTGSRVTGASLLDAGVEPAAPAPGAGTVGEGSDVHAEPQLGDERTQASVGDPTSSSDKVPSAPGVAWSQAWLQAQLLVLSAHVETLEHQFAALLRPDDESPSEWQDAIARRVDRHLESKANEQVGEIMRTAAGQLDGVQQRIVALRAEVEDAKGNTVEAVAAEALTRLETGPLATEVLGRRATLALERAAAEKVETTLRQHVAPLAGNGLVELLRALRDYPEQAVFLGELMRFAPDPTVLHMAGIRVWDAAGEQAAVSDAHRIYLRIEQEIKSLPDRDRLYEGLRAGKQLGAWISRLLDAHKDAAAKGWLAELLKSDRNDDGRKTAREEYARSRKAAYRFTWFTRPVLARMLDVGPDRYEEALGPIKPAEAVHLRGMGLADDQFPVLERFRRFLEPADRPGELGTLIPALQYMAEAWPREHLTTDQQDEFRATLSLMLEESNLPTSFHPLAQSLAMGAGLLYRPVPLYEARLGDERYDFIKQQAAAVDLEKLAGSFVAGVESRTIVRLERPFFFTEGQSGKPIYRSGFAHVFLAVR